MVRLVFGIAQLAPSARSRTALAAAAVLLGKAEEYLRKAIRADPEYAKAYRALVELKTRLGKEE